MYFLITIVFSFFIIMLVYARYLNVSGNISQRKLQLESLRDNVEFRVNKLKKGSAQIKQEIQEAECQLDDFKHSLNDVGGTE